MGFATIVCAMLLTKSGWTAASIMGVPAATEVSFAAVAFLARFVFGGLARGSDDSAGPRREIALGRWRGVWIPALLGLAVATAVAWFTVSQVPTKFGVLGVLLVTPCVALMLGAINGGLIVAGRLQPFIATLAMMVGALGIARLTAGQDNAVVAVYTGTNATESFEVLRSMLWGVVPMPSVFFLAAIILFGAILRFTAFGRYAYAIGGNIEAAKLSGIKVVQVQLTAYLLSGLLAGLAGVLFVAQYRQGKPDAGAGLELDAIAAVVIGGTSLMGGRGSLAGTFVGVLIFGLLSDILQLQNIDSNVQLVMKGLIIVCTVLVQEQNLGQLVARWRFTRRAKASVEAGPAEPIRPPSAAKAQFAREDLDEAS
jgi:simple sugar transport system permease protein